MSAFVSWILGILGIVVIGTILDIFLAEKKLGKTIKSVLASLIVLMVISPIPVMLTSLNGCEFKTNEIRLDENFLGYANRIKIQQLEKGVEEAFGDKGYKNVKVKIEAEIDTEIKISMVKIDLTDLVLDGIALNINKIERVRDLASDFLKIGKDKILIID